MVIKRVDAVSFGKLFAAMYAIFGLIGAGFALLLLLVGVRLDAGSAPLGATIVAGLLGLIAIPLFLAVSGFIGGAIGAFFFNLAAGYVGGVKIDVES